MKVDLKVDEQYFNKTLNALVFNLQVIYSTVSILK